VADATAVITRKIGGVPVWAYGVAAIVGVGAVVILKRRSSSAAKGAPTSDSGAASSLAEGSQFLGTGTGSAVPIIIPSPTAFNTGFQDGMTTNTVTPSTVSSVGSGSTTTTTSGASSPAPVAAAAPTPVAAPAPTPQYTPGSVVLLPRAWAPGGQAYYVVGWDYYGPGKGCGANEVAAVAHTTPQNIITWNGGKAFYASGQLVYAGSGQYGLGK
jgi:hypothetical protein